MTENLETIYINSIHKHISIEEYKSYYYKPGHVYKINSSYFHRCIGYDGYTPIIETYCCIIDKNTGDYQVIFRPAHKDVNGHYSKVSVIPSLDFVNKILCGEIKEIDLQQFDELINSFKCTIDNYGKLLELI